MSSYLYPGHFDLVTPDGRLTSLTMRDSKNEAIVKIKDISPAFLGFDLDIHHLFFNFKSVLAQLGLHAVTKEIFLDKKKFRAECRLEIFTYGEYAKKMLHLLEPGAYLGKLFAADERRRVRDTDYLLRMFNRTDQEHRPLLSLGSLGGDNLFFEKIDGRMVAFLTIQEGRIDYLPSISGLLPTIAKALHKKIPVRELLMLHHVQKNEPHIVQPGEILLVRTLPLHIRTVFGKVVESLLPKGYHHTSANILQPDTFASGDIYEFYGNASKEILDIPLEFYTLEPHREHIFFSDRDQLQQCLEDPKKIQQAFETAPLPKEQRAAVFIVKGTQMLSLKESDWIISASTFRQLPGSIHTQRQFLAVSKYIAQQPCYPFLQAMEKGLITSQGVLLTRYFPSPFMKRMFLSYYVQGLLMGIYFQIPSRTHGDFFSQEDRATLHDLARFGIPIYWVDDQTQKILSYVQRPLKTSGMFVPIERVSEFLTASFFGIYGSNLIASSFENELFLLFEQLLALRKELHHPLFNPSTPLALVTGGGPGAMEVGNRVAKSLNILSCANIVDFQSSSMNEQKQNPYVEAKMTYRLDHLIERQAEFYLDFPIFVMGGIGTDFEFALEQVRQKIGARTFSPILLFGPKEYWRKKISSAFTCNLDSHTIQGSEWVGNSFFCVQTAKEGLMVYRDFFEKKLCIGPKGPIVKDGFVTVSDQQMYDSLKNHK